VVCLFTTTGSELDIVFTLLKKTVPTVLNKAVKGCKRYMFNLKGPALDQNNVRSCKELLERLRTQIKRTKIDKDVWNGRG
jgi:hypothetical protein